MGMVSKLQVSGKEHPTVSCGGRGAPLSPGPGLEHSPHSPDLLLVLTQASWDRGSVQSLHLPQSHTPFSCALCPEGWLGVFRGPQAMGGKRRGVNIRPAICPLSGELPDSLVGHSAPSSPQPSLSSFLFPTLHPSVQEVKAPRFLCCPGRSV